MVRFLHTSDWQLGISRSFLDEGVSERYAHDRLERIRQMGRIATEEACAFVVVCGDVFESNQVGRKTILRALSALSEITVPVFLLPGNHDPLNEASVYRNRIFVENQPKNVTVLEDDTPVAVMPGVELIGAPWRAKLMAENPLHPVLERLEPSAGVLRVLAAHGEVDALSQMSDSRTMLRYDLMNQAVADGRAGYIALGDRHSLTRVDKDGRIWFSGTPEATAFREVNPGYVAVVELTAGGAEVKSVKTGEWVFSELERNVISGGTSVQELLAELESIGNKERCVLRLKLSGLLNLSETSSLRNRLGELRDLFAAFELEQSELHTSVDVDDIDNIGLTGFAASTASRLQTEVESGSPVARDALLLLAMLNR